MDAIWLILLGAAFGIGGGLLGRLLDGRLD